MADGIRTIYRSRLVGNQFRMYADGCLYAWAPPLEALCRIMREAATDDGTTRELMGNDVARVCFQARPAL